MRQIQGTVPAAEDKLREIGAAGDLPTPDLRPLGGDELRRAKRAYVTARIDLTRADRLLGAGVAPKSGDLLLARVARLGHHRKLESPSGRRQMLFAGDLVLVCYGARYASDQFEALVPADLAPCSLVAAGGIAAACKARHASARKPTEIEPLGFVADSEGRILNLADCAEARLPAAPQRPYALAVVGSSMNAGKTTTVAAMIRGLARSGLRVGAAKITGTGAGCDRWAMVDAGAEAVLDFTDFGHASTYRVPVAETAAVLEAAIAALGREGCDVVALELADGLLFPETADLVEHDRFRELVNGVLLAAGDSMSAGFGAAWLRRRDLPLLGLAGKLTSSPLMMREVEAAVEEPVLPLEVLESGRWTKLVGRAGKRAAA
jgi:hypothetical protein